MKKKIKKNKKKIAWRRLSAVMNRVGRRHEAIAETEVERDALEAVAAVRKAQTIERFNRLLEITSSKPITMKDLERTRAKVWKEEFEPKVRAKKIARKKR